MQDYLSEDDAGILVSKFSAVRTLCRFLNEQELVKHTRVYEDASEDLFHQLDVFVKRLSVLGGSRRATTQKRDYVAAVWVDCPGYRSPQDFKHMSLNALLQNSVLQLEETFGVSIPVTAITGLFGLDEATSLWRPVSYLDPERVKHIGHM
jgi:hypothetical protein